MSQGDRNRSRSARERIAAQQAAARQAERRRRLLIGGGSVGLVLVVVLIFVVVALSNHKKQAGSGTLPASVVRNITSVSASTLATVAGGSVPASPPLVTPITDTPLISNGKPEMLYIGAEFCPFCAAMRWSMAVALSRFGSFGPLRGIHSSSRDTDPNTPTLTFHGSSYTSKYLTFVPVENETITRGPLQPVTAQQQALWTKYNANSYPFIDFGNKFVIKGPLYDPAVLAGLTWAQVAQALHDPASPVAQGADGAANYITAAICKMTGNQPASVCAAAPIPALEAKI